MASLHRNAAIYLVANIAVAAVPFLLLPILTRYLDAEEYGVVAMFTTLLPLLGALVGLSVHGAISRRWYDKSEVDIAQYVAGCVSVLLVSSSLVGGGLFWGAGWISEKISVPVFWLYGALFVSFFSFLIQIRLVLWQVAEKPVMYAAFQVGSALINACVSIFLVVILAMGAEGRIWGYSLAFFLFGLLSVAWLFRDGLITYKTQWSYVRDALVFGVPLVPHVIGGFLLLLAGRIIVNDKLGLESAGVYMVAAQIALGLEVVNTAVNKAFVPWVFSRLKVGMRAERLRIVKLTYIYFIFLFAVAGLVYFLSGYIVLVLAGAEYAMAAEILPWLVMAQVFNGMYYLVTNYIFYERKTHIVAIITVFCGGLSVVLTWLLVAMIGLKGAAIGAAIAMLFQFVLSWIAAAKIHPMPWLIYKPDLPVK